MTLLTFHWWLSDFSAYDRRNQVPVLVRDCEIPAEFFAQAREHLEAIYKRWGFRFVCTLEDLWPTDITKRWQKHVEPVGSNTSSQVNQKEAGTAWITKRLFVKQRVQPAAGVSTWEKWLGHCVHWAPNAPHAISSAQSSGRSWTSGSRDSHQHVSFESQQQQWKNEAVQREAGKDNRKKIYLCTSTQKWTLLHASTLIQTVRLGRSATSVLAAREGQPAWMARVAADQYQMHLALHLYHVSAPLPRRLEIFRSMWRETQAGRVGAAGVGPWVKNQLRNSETGESVLSSFLFFVPSATWQTWHSHEFNVRAPRKSPRVLLSDRWGEVKIAQGGKATPSYPSSPRPSAPPPWTPTPFPPTIRHHGNQHGAHFSTSPPRQRSRQYKGAYKVQQQGTWLLGGCSEGRNPALVWRGWEEDVVRRPPSSKQPSACTVVHQEA